MERKYACYFNVILQTFKFHYKNILRQQNQKNGLHSSNDCFKYDKFMASNKVS